MLCTAPHPHPSPHSPHCPLFFYHGHASHLHLHSFPTRRSSDLAAPIVRKTTRAGASVSHTGIASTSDTFFISYHGMAHTHMDTDRKSTRLNSSHSSISYAVFCLKKKRN